MIAGLVVSGIAVAGDAKPPVVSGFTPSSASVGTRIVIIGSHFNGASSVRFNGVAAPYAVDSDNQITASVPTGAATGPISVVGVFGTGTSPTPFSVASGGGALPDLYLSPSGSDTSPCTSGSPCRSFSRAYQIAVPGSRVQVTCPGGSSCSYPAQTIPYTLSKTGTYTCRAAEAFPDGVTTANDSSGCVAYLPGSGSSPTIASAAIEVPFVQLNGLAFTADVFAGSNLARTDAPCSAWNVHDVVFRNITATSFTLDDATYTYLVGGSYGPLLNQASHVAGCQDSPGNYAQGNHLAFDGITMHDYRQTQAGAHMECIHYQAGDNSVIANSKFLNCAQQDISIQTNLHHSSINGLLVQNNVFDAACSHAQSGDRCGVVSGGTTTFICSEDGETLGSVVMRFNSLNGSPSFQPNSGCSMGTFNLSGNILIGPSTSDACTKLGSAGVTLSYNAFTNATGVTCGTGNTLGVTPANTWNNPANYDYTLKQASLAINLVPLTSPYPATDIAGTPRPQSLSPDAGAYEYR